MQTLANSEGTGLMINGQDKRERFAAKAALIVGGIRKSAFAPVSRNVPVALDAPV